MKRLKEKGFPKGLVTEAFNKVKNLSQEQLLNKMETNRDDNKKPWNKKSINQSINFTTTFNTAQGRIRSILRKKLFYSAKRSLLERTAPQYSHGNIQESTHN